MNLIEKIPFILLHIKVKGNEIDVNNKNLTMNSLLLIIFYFHKLKYAVISLFVEIEEIPFCSLG